MIGMPDERVWLTREIDGAVRHWHCPADAVEAWVEMGWQPCEAPPEPVDPAIAHLVEARRQAADEQTAAEQVAAAAEQPPAAAKPKPTTRTSRSAGGETQE